MNKQQYEAALAIIKADCEGTQYLLADGKTCAVGALLRLANVLDEALEGHSTPTSVQYDILYHTYGLDRYDAESLMIANDQPANVLKRKITVAAALTQIYEES